MNGGATSQPAGLDADWRGIPSTGVPRRGCWNGPPLSVEGWIRQQQDEWIFIDFTCCFCVMMSTFFNSESWRRNVP